MKHTIFMITILVVLAAFSAACAAQDVSGAANEAAPEPAGQVQDQASLVEALRAAGAEVDLGDPVEQAFFAVEGRILKVNGADVQVFEYESAEAMEAEAAQVSVDGGSIGTSMVAWVATPHFFKSGRVLVLYIGDDVSILGLLMSALGEQFAGR